METQRLFLFFLFFLLLFLLWQAWQRDYGQEGQKAASTAAKTAPAASPRGATQVPELPPDNRPPVGAAAPEAVPAEPVQGVEIRTDVLALTIDPHGAAVRSVRLLQYPVELDGEEAFALIGGNEADVLSVQGGVLSAQSSISLPGENDRFEAAEQSYALEGEDLEVRLRWSGSSDGELQIDKVFLLRRGSYVIESFYEIRNFGEVPWKGRAYAQIQFRDSDTGIISFTSGGYSWGGIAFSSPDERYRKIDSSDIEKQDLARDIANGWIAHLQRYFLAAVLPVDPQEQYHYYTLSPSLQRYIAGSIAPSLQVAPGGEGTIGHRLYLGPKLQHSLADTAPGLELTLDYGWLWFIAKALFFVLVWLQGFTGNWGVSIILLTLMVKILFYHLSALSYRSMARMRRLQPRMMALKDRYGDDRQSMHQAVMKLYREEKVNPFGGCLPVVVQIPVFIALYWVLLESVELRQAEFAFWIRDLSTRDPYFVLPVVMGATMYLQQKLNPPIADPVQQRIISLLPWIFTVLFAFFPSGLVLYWLANNTLSLLQQKYVYARIEKETATGATG